MAGINKYMKPAEQPLLDTYVPLPFKEMSMAYQVKQKEHTEAETLAGTLDDDLLKVRASTPLHSKELGNIRTGLDTELKDLVDKHGGRYADMVPELNKIKTRLDKDFRDGSLYSIKETTRLKGKLDKAVVKSEESEKYSDLYSPRLGAESEFTDFYNLGLMEDPNSPGRAMWSTDPNAGWTTTGDGRRILDTYAYTGVHQGVQQTKLANELTFDKIKPDIDGFRKETKEGLLSQSELKQISLSKIYRAANSDIQSYPDNFQDELNVIVRQDMTPENVFQSAANVLDNIYGAVPANEQLAEAKQEQLDSLGTAENPKDNAYHLAKVAWIGSIGEKYLMVDDTWSQTFTGKAEGAGYTQIPKTDWVPVVVGDTPEIQTGKPMTLDGSGYISESTSPTMEYSKVIDNKRQNLVDIKTEYDNLVNSGVEMDDEYHAEWQQKINNAQYQYESNAFALGNLLQHSAQDLNARKVGNTITFTTDRDTDLAFGISNASRVGEQTITIGSAEYNAGGWSTIQFDENGIPFDPEDASYKQGVRLRGPQSYTNMNSSMANGITSLSQTTPGGFLGGKGSEGVLSKAAKIRMSTTGKDGFFSGRTKVLQLSNTSGSKDMDEAMDASLTNLVTKEDFNFTTSGGTPTTLKNLLNGIEDKGQQKKITQETHDNMTELIQTSQFSLVPDPSTGNYVGMVSVPLADDSNFFSSDIENASIDLFFPAPKEYGETLRRQGEFEEVIDDVGSTIKVTRPRTALEKAKFDNVKMAQIDIGLAGSIPGDIAMSSHEDGEGNPLGYYYFAQGPDGQPIKYEQYMFQPRAGLVKDINPQDGSTIFTTGNEIYNVDTEVGDLGYLIAMNDPTKSANRDYWLQQAQAPSAPIALENTVLDTKSVGVGMDMSGTPFQTNLGEGQTMLVDDRATKEFTTRNKINPQFIGLQKPIAGLLNEGSKNYTDEFATTLNNKLDANMEALPVTLADGSTISLEDAFSAGYVTLQPKNQQVSDGSFSVNVSSGPRTYQGQLDKYDAWIAGGKKGPQIANPAQGGFHVMGQAIDLSQTKSDYDWVLTTDNSVTGIGGSSVGSQGLQTADGPSGGNGVAINELKLSNGKLLMPDFYNQSLNSLLKNLTTKPVKMGVVAEQMSKVYNMPEGQNIEQFNKEWWHLSYGEVTNQPGASFVYPSWAN
tara:strand:- start:36073 stop:39573 length:3501 start_codon:yes stop_codon:yes gene_type:complete